MNSRTHILGKLLVGGTITTLLSAVLILYRFTEIPPMMALDEQEFAILAMSLEGNPYIVYSPLATGHTTIYFYTILASMQLFGFDTFGLRLPAAMSAIAAAALMFGILSILFGYSRRRAWFLVAATTGIFITSRWFITFSRFAFEATFLLMFELGSVLAILLYGKKGQWRYLILSAICAGLAFHSYTPGRIFWVVPASYILYKTVKKHGFSGLKKHLKPIVVFLGIVGVLALPLLAYLATNTDTRIYQQFFITNEQLTIGTRLAWLIENIGKTLGMFAFVGDINGIHNYPGKPALNPLIGLLSLVGLIRMIRGITHARNVLFLTYTAVSLIPTILTYPWENPHMLRTFTLLPAIAYAAGMGIELMFIRINSYYRYGLAIVMTLLILGSSLYEIRTYFVHQASVFPDIFIHSIRFEDYRNPKPPSM